MGRLCDILLSQVCFIQFMKAVFSVIVVHFLPGSLRGVSLLYSAPPLYKSPQIPSSQLGTREVKMRRQIGPLANLLGNG